MTTKLDAALAELEKAIMSAPSARPKVPKPKPKGVIEKATVQVAKSDPNWSKENRGRVEVEVRRIAEPVAPARRDIYEEMYWRAVDREMAGRPIFSEVVSSYDPFAPERMPGYDGDD